MLLLTNAAKANLSRVSQYSFFLNHNYNLQLAFKQPALTRIDMKITLLIKCYTRKIRK